MKEAILEASEFISALESFPPCFSTPCSGPALLPGRSWKETGDVHCSTLSGVCNLSQRVSCLFLLNVRWCWEPYSLHYNSACSNKTLLLKQETSKIRPMGSSLLTPHQDHPVMPWHWRPPLTSVDERVKPELQDGANFLFDVLSKYRRGHRFMPLFLSGEMLPDQIKDSKPKGTRSVVVELVYKETTLLEEWGWLPEHKHRCCQKSSFIFLLELY